MLMARRAQAKSAADYWQDTSDYFTAPLHWEPEDWGTAGGIALGVAAAYSIDGRVHRHFAPDDPTGSGGHGVRDAMPLAAMFAGTFAVGALGDEQYLDTGLDMGEAVALSFVSAHALKLVLGRERPYQTDSKDRFGKGGSSFPSGHVTAAFAAAQVLADEIPADQWGWRVVAYGLAGTTAYARLHGNAHWLSDTVAGAALGIVSGRFVSNRRADCTTKVSMSLAPMNRGALVAFALSFH
ncbi:MAG: phosphatase PAP2 family protein [Pseudomonadota bacterium]